MDHFTVIPTRKELSVCSIFENIDILRSPDQKYPHILTFSNTLCRWEVRKLRTGNEPFDRVVFHSSKMPAGPASYNLLTHVVSETMWHTGPDFYCDLNSGAEIPIKTLKRRSWMGMLSGYMDLWFELWWKSINESRSKSWWMNLDFQRSFLFLFSMF